MRWNNCIFIPYASGPPDGMLESEFRMHLLDEFYHSQTMRQALVLERVFMPPTAQTVFALLTLPFGTGFKLFLCLALHTTKAGTETHLTHQRFHRV